MKGNFPESSLTFLEHIEELRWRALFCVGVFFFWVVVGYLISDRIISFMFALYPGELVSMSLTAGIDLVITTTVAFAFFFSFPVIVYQLLVFLRPALQNITQRHLWLIVGSASGLFIAGAVFAIAITLPATIRFLLSFQPESARYLVSSTTFIFFLIRYVSAFGLLFQIPLVILIWNRIRRLETRVLIKQLKPIVFGSFVFAAILTPTPDIVNQLLMAGPIIGLFVVSILLLHLVNHTKTPYSK